MAGVQDMSQDKPLTATSAIQETAITADHGVGPTHDDKALATTAAMQETTIAELRPTSYDKVLEARVYIKWIAITYLKNGTKKRNWILLHFDRSSGTCCLI